MSTLTRTDFEEIQNKLEFLNIIIDNQLYSNYTVEGLKGELDSIEALCSKIQETLEDEE